jgi:hypothetical protein
MNRQGEVYLAMHTLGSGLFINCSVAPTEVLKPTLAVTKDFDSKNNKLFRHKKHS